MKPIRVTVSLHAMGPSQSGYKTDFLVDMKTTNSIAPASKLKAIGIMPVGKDGGYEFGLVVIEFMGDITAGRVIFGPEGVEPILGVTALESTGIILNPKDHTLKRLPAIPLKRQLVAA